MKKAVMIVLAAVAGFTVGGRAADWPNWRGPNHNGISAETGWVAKWPDDGPKQLWKAAVGTGFSCVTVAQGRAYTIGNQKDTDTVYCFDAGNGSNLWKYSYACPLNPNIYEGGPNASVTVDAGRAYVINKLGGLYCLDAETGKVIWTKSVAAQAGAESPVWGYSGSVLVQGNLLILDIGVQGMAVDRATGEMVWSSKEMGGYATPVPCSFGGTPAVVLVSKDTVFGLEIKTGHPLWSFPWKTEYDLNIADALVSGNDVFVSSGYDRGATMVRISGATASPVWENRSLRTHVSSSVLADGYIYGVDGQQNNAGEATLKCLEFATGNEKWNFEGLGGGALMVADHKIIMLSDKGELVTAQASPAGFTPISRVQVLGGKCWTVPTLANGRIYCRNAKGEVLCLDVQGK